VRELEEFAQLAEEQGASIRVRAERSPEEDFLQPDALLQTPLIAFCLLMTTYGSRTGLEAGQTASLTSAIFAEYFVGLGDARGRLAWSPAMRIKCAEALADLEAMGFVLVEGVPRRFTLTTLGKEAVRSALKEPRTEIGTLARGLRRAYEDVEAMGLKLL
jgi:hypothetical protein